MVPHVWIKTGCNFTEGRSTIHCLTNMYKEYIYIRDIYIKGIYI